MTCSKWMSWNVTEIAAIYHLLLVVCSKNVSVLRHFWDITTAAVYMCLWSWEDLQFW